MVDWPDEVVACLIIFLLEVKSQSLILQCRGQREGSFALPLCSLATRILAVLVPLIWEGNIQTSLTSIPAL